MSELWSAVRQKTFPRPFRIEAGAAEDWAESLAAALAGAKTAAREPSPAVSEPSAAPTGPPALAEDFVRALCDHQFRLRRNAAQLAAEGANSKELRSIRRALEGIDELLAEHGIECRDLTGEDYDFLRLDFEQIGQAETIPGLAGMKIWRCERPAVLVDGKLVQCARGIVARPA